MLSASRGRSKVPVAITVIGVGLAGVILVAVASDWAPSTKAQSGGYDPRRGGRVGGGAVESEIAALRSELRRVEAKQAVIASHPPGEDSPLDQKDEDQADTTDAVEEPVPPELVEVRAQEMAQAQVDLLTATWSSEEPDPEWSASASAALNAAYVGEMFEGLEARAECRWSLCKVVLALESEDALRSVDSLALQSPWKGKGFYRVDTETKQGVFFLAREDYDLPVPQALAQQ